MSVRTVLVCEAQVPLVEGGAERLVRELAHQLTRRGYVTGIVSVPFKWYPKQEILTHAAAWRLIDLSESNGQPIDLVIGTKFPSYFVRHPNKVTWLTHQYRAAYELCGTEFSDFDYTELDVALRERIFALDREMLLESRRIYTIARNVAGRLEKHLGIPAAALYHPPKLADRLRCGEFGNYVLSVCRLESIKRVDLAIRALPHVDAGVRLVVVGDGTQRANVERLAEETGVGDRVDFLGARSDEEVIDLYAGALGVFNAPYDEDYGYVTLEAFLSGKPVITATDSGGVLEFVEDGVTGRVCAPVPEAFAQAINDLASSRARAASMGASGRERARAISWDGVIEKLVGAQLKKLIVQIPCLNEAKTLPATLADLPRQVPGIDVIETLIIDDGSTDGTSEVARAHGVDHVVRFPRHKGLAAAFTAGIDACLKLGADFIVNTDGDNQYCGKDVPTLLGPLLAGEADIVIGDRNIQAVEHMSAMRKLLQRLGSWVVRQVSNTQVPDTTSGFRAYSREAALRLTIVSEFSYTLESIIQAGKKRIAIAHVPIATNPHTRESRLFGSAWTYVKASTATIVRIYAMYEPLKVLTSIGAVVFLAGLAISARFLYFYITGAGLGHLQSLILSAVLMIVGFQVVLIGLAADVIAGNRKLIEDLLYRVRGIELTLGDRADIGTRKRE